MGWILPRRFFYQDNFGIKSPTNINMPLNKEIRP